MAAEVGDLTAPEREPGVLRSALSLTAWRTRLLQSVRDGDGDTAVRRSPGWRSAWIRLTRPLRRIGFTGQQRQTGRIKLVADI